MSTLQFNNPSAVLGWLTTTLGGHGLQTRGWFWVDGTSHLPALATGAASLLVLVGHAGSGFWPYFSRSAEYADGLADPLDRWSQRIGDELASTCGGQAWYPFTGPPYQPFQQWADRCEPLAPSPLGLRIHPHYGLWHAYRLALQIPMAEPALHEPFATIAATATTPPASLAPSPCQTCADQPCLKACPVQAFTPAHYDVPRCTAYLHQASQQHPHDPCIAHTCQARWACPVGMAFRYSPEHGAFHMRQFAANHPLPEQSSRS